MKNVGNYFSQTKQFITSVRQEFAKVLWPTKKELFGVAGVVLIVVAAFSLYLGILDIVISQVAQKVLSL